MPMHDWTKCIGNFTPPVCDFSQNHPPILGMGTSPYVIPAFERIDQPGNRRPADDQPGGDFIWRNGRLTVCQHAENQRGGGREVELPEQSGYPAG